MQKILYIKAQWLGDIIGWLPFLVQQKLAWNKVYQTFYDMRHINKWVEKLSKEQQENYKKFPMYHGWYSTLETIKNAGLIEEILFIPYGFWNLVKFIFSNFKKYHLAVVPIKTLAGNMFANLLGRSKRIIFSGVNDTSKYRTLSEWECDWKWLLLHQCLSYIKWPTEQVNIQWDYITIFPCIYERSLDMEHWIAIIDYVQKLGLKIVIVWWVRENWFIQELEKLINLEENGIINLLDKTTIPQLSYVLQHSKYCISWNGWPMRIANLMNSHCINIHTTSSFLMEPAVDNKTSFNLRGYHYPQCQPCESAGSTVGEHGIRWCVFYGTEREGECRKFNTAQQVILIIKRSIVSN